MECHGIHQKTHFAHTCTYGIWKKLHICLVGKTDSIQGEKPEKLFCTNFAFLDIWKNSNSIIVYHGFWVVYTYSQNFWVTPQNKSSMLATRQRCFGDFEWIYYLVCIHLDQCVLLFLILPYHTSECPSDNGFCRSVPSGDWSNCLIVADGGSRSGSISTTEGPSSIIASPFCGIGKRYRRLDCLDMSNQLAESM